MAGNQCHVRIVASWLPKDVVCIREEHLVGAHMNEDGKPFLITTREAKSKPLRKRVIRKPIRKRVVRIKRR
jgi:hypothetical protein